MTEVTLGEAARRGQPPPEVDPPDAKLVEEYKALRKSMKSGPARTGKMERVVARMIALAPSLQAFDVRVALESKDQGKRLAAFAGLSET